jgi:hypothetical protein
MTNSNWSDWAARVVRHIRFFPDREGVEQELLGHLEDKTEDILGQKQIPTEDAERLALETMGDADELGRQLNKVHNAWLGYLWLLSKWALIACLVAVVFAFCLFCDDGYLVRDDDENWMDSLVERQNVADYAQYQHITRLTQSCVDESDGYIFTVPEVMVWYNEGYTVSGEDEGEVYSYEMAENTGLYLTVRARTRLPDLHGCKGFYGFYAVDDRGNVYENVLAFSEDGTVMPRLTGNVVMTSLWSSEYRAYIPSVDPEAAWVELRYDRDGRDVQLRVDLTGGESA